MIRPRMSKRIVSPTLIWNRSWMPCSIDTSASGDGPFQNAPSTIVSFGFEVIAIGDRVLAASEPRARTSSKLSRLVSRPLTPVTRARSTGISRDCAGAVRRIGEERAHAVDLLALDVHQEHVRRVLGDLHRELLEQARLQRPDADDEERAEADGEQDDPRLVARPRQVQHGVAQRKRRRLRQRRDRAHQQPAGQLQHERQPAESGADDQADRAATPPARRSAPTSAGRHQHHRGDAASSRGGRASVSSRSSSDGLTSRTSSSGTTENSSDTSTPTPMPCTAALQRHAVVDLGQERRRAAERERDRRDRRRAPARRRAGCRPGRASAPAACRRR